MEGGEYLAFSLYYVEICAYISTLSYQLYGSEYSETRLGWLARIKDLFVFEWGLLHRTEAKGSTFVAAILEQFNDSLLSKLNREKLLFLMTTIREFRPKHC